jgi:hypothetical protein
MQSTTLKSRPGQASTQSWRGVLPIHPAAKLLPRMSEDGLRELGDDIKRNGQHNAISIFTDAEGVEWLLDGINRLDAMELVGLPIVKDAELNSDIVRIQEVPDNTNPVKYVLGANIFRRHLTNEQKKELVEKLLELMPKASDRQIGKLADVSHPKVAKVRDEMERRGKISTSKTRTDTKGRKQPARKAATSPTKSKSNTVLTDPARTATGGLAHLWGEATPEQRSKFVDLVGLKAIFAAAPRNLQGLFLAQTCPALVPRPVMEAAP